MSTGGTTSKNRNSLFYRLLGFFLCLIGNILATNHVFSVKKQMLKVFIPSSFSKRGGGFHGFVFLYRVSCVI